MTQAGVQRDRDDRRWLVTEARIGEGPLLLRLGEPAERIEGEVGRTYRNLVAIIAAGTKVSQLWSAVASALATVTV